MEHFVDIDQFWPWPWYKCLWKELHVSVATGLVQRVHASLVLQCQCKGVANGPWQFSVVLPEFKIKITGVLHLSSFLLILSQMSGNVTLKF